jgi:hypothetical protein
VGYAMKPSREQQLADQGLLPLLPAPAVTPSGARCYVCFAPLDLGQPLGPQGHWDAVLHKASDELVATPGAGGAPEWSAAMQGLQRQLEGRPDVAVVDPFEAAAKVGLADEAGTPARSRSSTVEQCNAECLAAHQIRPPVIPSPPTWFFQCTGRR